MYNSITPSKILKSFHSKAKPPDDKYKISMYFPKGVLKGEKPESTLHISG